MLSSCMHAMHTHTCKNTYVCVSARVSVYVTSIPSRVGWGGCVCMHIFKCMRTYFRMCMCLHILGVVVCAIRMYVHALACSPVSKVLLTPGVILSHETRGVDVVLEPPYSLACCFFYCVRVHWDGCCTSIACVLAYRHVFGTE